MKKHLFPSLSALVVLALASSAAQSFAQNAIKVFGATNVRLSSSSATYANPVTFNSSNLNLSCDTTAGPITAVLSSTPDGTGNILVDNFINLTVTTTNGTTGPTNICRGGTADNVGDATINNCFSASYEGSAQNLVGQSPDTFVATGGVAPIDISASLAPGSVKATVGFVDEGGFLANSTVYLVTSCTQAGVTGPATVTGNPISSNNPPPSQLSQDFTFDPTQGQAVGFTYDLVTAQGSGALTITDGTIPNTNDNSLDPALWQSQYVPGTSFATSSCLIHTGEALPSGASGCKIYTLTCQIGTGSTSAGAQCPISTLRNEAFKDAFTGPKFTLPDVTGPNGHTYHQGVGFIMAKEGWTGGACVFDPLSGLQGFDCPQNLLTSFSSPGVPVPVVKPVTGNAAALFGVTSNISPTSDDEDMDISGTSTNPNSTFVSAAQVPEDLTTVTIPGAHAGWINSHSFTVDLSSEPPQIPSTVANYQNFVASPILGITYGLSPASLIPGTQFPVPGDVTLTNPVACPVAPNLGNPPATVFTPSPVTVTAPGDGMFALHYFAQDCAGTEELKFTPVGNGGWSTSFFTVPVNIDTVVPVVASGPTLSPAPTTINGVPNSYTLNQAVTATYSCTDDASGVAKCGGTNYSTPGTLNTGNLVSSIDTSSAGSKSFTVPVTDIAGNVGTPVTVNYNVVGSPADLSVLMIGPGSTPTGSTLTYEALVLNYGPNKASSVVIKDALPAGTTLVSAEYQLISCGFTGCNGVNPEANCSVSGSNITCNAGDLKALSLSSLQGITVEIVVKVTAPAKTVLSNTMNVSSSNSDPHPANNTSTVMTTVTK